MKKLTRSDQMYGSHSTTQAVSPQGSFNPYEFSASDGFQVPLNQQPIVLSGPSFASWEYDLYSPPTPGYAHGYSMEQEVTLPSTAHLPAQSTYDGVYYATQSNDSLQSYTLSFSDASSVSSSSNLSCDSKKKRTFERPHFSYNYLIHEAIKSFPEEKATVARIYERIVSLHPEYPISKLESKGWKNCVRHNLSLYNGYLFIKEDKAVTGGACYWMINPKYRDVFQTEDDKRRYRRRGYMYQK